MTGRVRRFLTEDGWSEWENIHSISMPPVTHDYVMTYSGKEILKAETKLASEVEAELEYLDSDKITMKQMAIVRDLGDKMNEQLKEQFFASLGITLNSEEEPEPGPKQKINPYAEVEGFGDY